MVLVSACAELVSIGDAARRLPPARIGVTLLRKSFSIQPSHRAFAKHVIDCNSNELVGRIRLCLS